MADIMKAPRGTRDILPGESERWELLNNVAQEIFGRYGYSRIVTPTFELTDVFQRAIGQESEIVQKQMYTFQDKGGRSLTLRPEGTASVVRAYVEHNLGASGPLPVKLYYGGQMFRYERPQAGRYREFWQLGVEVLGSDDPTLDAEVISMLNEFYETLGLKGLVTLINSMGCPECRPAYIKLLSDFLDSAEGLCPECEGRRKTNPLRIFDCKQPGCHETLKDAPKISDNLCESCERHFGSVKELLADAGVQTEHDEMLVRGFDYYQRTTFEVQSGNLGAQNAIGGGGRYDGLVEQYGGPPTPAIGFAVGCERILLALGDNIKGEVAGLDVFIVVIDHTMRKDAFRIARTLRAAGISCDMDFTGRSVKSQMKQANKRAAKSVLFLGPDEFEQGKIKLRNMESGDETEVSTDSLAGAVKGMLV